MKREADHSEDRTGAVRATTAADQAAGSELAGRVAALRAQMADLHAIDRDKVVGVAAVIARGEYAADFRDVARKLLRDLLGELLG